MYQVSLSRTPTGVWNHPICGFYCSTEPCKRSTTKSARQGHVRDDGEASATWVPIRRCLALCQRLSNLHPERRAAFALSSRREGLAKKPLLRTRVAQVSGPWRRSAALTRRSDPRLECPAPGADAGSWTESKAACEQGPRTLVAAPTQRLQVLHRQPGLLHTKADYLQRIGQ